LKQSYYLVQPEPHIWSKNRLFCQKQNIIWSNNITLYGAKIEHYSTKNRTSDTLLSSSIRTLCSDSDQDPQHTQETQQKLNNMNKTHNRPGELDNPFSSTTRTDHHLVNIVLRIENYDHLSHFLLPQPVQGTVGITLQNKVKYISNVSGYHTYNRRPTDRLYILMS
jgi:hypothetical protein